MTIRCKMKCMSVRKFEENGETTQESISLHAVYDADPASENYSWSKYTPSATFQVTISNPACFGFYVEGQSYYLDSLPAT